MILREALIEHYLSGNSVSEIANCLNLSVTAVESRLKRGRRALRTRLAMRGVSLTVVAASCIRFQQDVVATTALPWTSRFMELIGNVGVGCPTLSKLTETNTVNPQLIKLVQRELVMKPFARSILGTTGGLLVLSAIGTLGFLSAFANHQSSSLLPAKGDSEKSLALAISPSSELESTEAGSFILAQSGAAGGMGGGGGTVGPPAGTNMPKKVAIKWEKPNGPPPPWLDSQNFDNKVEIELRNSLHRRIDVDFNATPLGEAIKVIRDKLDIPLFVDEKALEEESITLDEPITLERKQARLVDILGQILEPLQLTFALEYEAFLITSRKTSANEIRFYDMSYLFPDSGLIAELMNGLESSVARDQWEMSGGVCSMRVVGSMLVIGAPYDVHFAVERFLNKLSKQSPTNLKSSVP